MTFFIGFISLFRYFTFRSDTKIYVNNMCIHYTDQAYCVLLLVFDFEIQCNSNIYFHYNNLIQGNNKYAQYK